MHGGSGENADGSRDSLGEIASTFGVEAEAIIAKPKVTVTELDDNPLNLK